MSRIYFTAEDAADAIEELEEDLPLENLIGDCEDETQLSSDDYESESDVSQGEEDEAATVVARRRAPAFSKRLVHDINSALDEDNYSMLQPAYNNAKVYTTALNHSNNNEIPEITWTTMPPSSGRQPRSAVILGEPGVTGIAKEAKDQLQCWDLFFSAHMINLIVSYTNEKIAAARRSSSFNYCFFSTDSVEIVGFIGLVYLRGLLCMNLHDIKYVYDFMFGQPFFRATMSKERFKFLRACISFDNGVTRNERWKKDKFSAIREIFELFNQNCSKHVVPNDYLSLDETLYPMRTRIGFRQFNPNKPVKYGLLFKSINLARYSYTFTSMPYCGKPECDASEYSEFYVQGTENAVKYLVNKLNSYCDLQGRNITHDRLYTSIPLAKWLLSHNITCLGTIQANRKGIPKEIKDIADREPLSYEYFREENEKKLVLNSWVTRTKTSGFKNVLLLSTVSPLLGVTKDDNKKKPAIYKLYDFTKGGTDIVDQRIGLYTCRTKSRRWTMSAFSYILDTCRVHAATVYALNHGKDPRKIDAQNFIGCLVKQMISLLLRRRQLTGLHAAVKNDIKTVIQWLDQEAESNTCVQSQPAGSSSNDQVQQKHPTKGEKRRRCYVCVSEISGRPDYSKKIIQMSASKNQCQECCKPTCSKHTFQICPECEEKRNPKN